MSDAPINVIVPGNHLMPGLLGHRDELLRLVEDAFPDTAIHVRGNEITISGPDAEPVGRLFEELVLLLQQGQPIDTRQHGPRHRHGASRRTPEPGAHPRDPALGARAALCGPRQPARSATSTPSART